MSFVDSSYWEAFRAFGWRRKTYDCGAERTCKLRNTLEILDVASCGFRRFCHFWDLCVPCMYRVFGQEKKIYLSLFLRFCLFWNLHDLHVFSQKKNNPWFLPFPPMFHCLCFLHLPANLQSSYSWTALVFINFQVVLRERTHSLSDRSLSGYFVLTLFVVYSVIHSTTYISFILISVFPPFFLLPLYA